MHKFVYSANTCRPRVLTCFSDSKASSVYYNAVQTSSQFTTKSWMILLFPVKERGIIPFGYVTMVSYSLPSLTQTSTMAQA